MHPKCPATIDSLVFFGLSLLYRKTWLASQRYLVLFAGFGQYFMNPASDEELHPSTGLHRLDSCPKHSMVSSSVPPPSAFGPADRAA